MDFPISPANGPHADCRLNSIDKRTGNGRIPAVEVVVLETLIRTSLMDGWG